MASQHIRESTKANTMHAAACDKMYLLAFPIHSIFRKRQSQSEDLSPRTLNPESKAPSHPGTTSPARQNPSNHNRFGRAPSQAECSQRCKEPVEIPPEVPRINMETGMQIA